MSGGLESQLLKKIEEILKSDSGMSGIIAKRAARDYLDVYLEHLAKKIVRDHYENLD